MDLGDLDWGDVLVDTGDVMVCQARLADDQVVVKRWRDGALDAELAARRLLAGAGVATAQLLGWGPGWLVLEDLSESVWRQGDAADLGDADVAAALGRWYAAAHRVTGPEVATLPPSPSQQVLVPQVLDAVAGLLPAGTREAVARWQELVAPLPQVLVVGGFDAASFAVVGAGLAAMPTDLSPAHRGHALADLARVAEALTGPLAERFLEAWAEHSGQPLPGLEQLQAQAALELTVEAVVQILAQGAPDPHVDQALGRHVAELPSR